MIKNKNNARAMLSTDSEASKRAGNYYKPKKESVYVKHCQ